MKAVTPEQIKIIHTILPRIYREDRELKGVLISQFTEDDHRRSTKDLSFYQAEELIHFLKTGKKKDYSYYAHFDTQNKQHRYILSLCHQIGWETYSQQYNRLVVDLSALGGWLYKYGYKHQPLGEYCTHELPRLVTQFENLVRYKMKRNALT